MHFAKSAGGLVGWLIDDVACGSFRYQLPTRSTFAETFRATAGIFARPPSCGCSVSPLRTDLQLPLADEMSE
jgi:hypothetical protein